MRDYGQIVTKLTSTIWLITPEGLDMILEIANTRLNGNDVTQEQLESAASARAEREYNTWGAQIHRGVGILPIAGPIFGKANMMTSMSGATSLEEFKQDFRKMMSNDEVHSVVLEMDTPGGSSELLSETADEIYSTRDVKPTYAISNAMCGSAGLWLATQATQLFSTPSGQTGSLGVYRVHRDQSGKNAQDGYNFTYVKAGKFKTEGNPHEPLSPEATAFHQEGVNETYGEFLEAVSRGRGKSVDLVKSSFGEGRMLSARRAREVGMTDGTMQMESLVTQLANQYEAKASNPAHTFSFYFASDTEIPTSTTTTEKGDKMDREKLLGIAQQLGIQGITDAVSDEDLSKSITAAIQTQNAELTELRPLKTLQEDLEGTRSFRENYPDEYARMQGLEETNRVNAAAAFTGRVSKFTKLEGDKAVPDNTRGFSGVALEAIEDVHQKFASHTATVADFENFVTLLSTGKGIVDFTEAGSGRTEEGEKPVLNGALDARMQFDKLVTAVGQKPENADKPYMEIVKLAAVENPELYQAYRSPVMASRN